LFGDCDLVREWGRIIRTAIYPNQAAAAALAAAVKQRHKRGYRTIAVMTSRCRTLHLDFASPDAQPARFSAGATA
jgi:predicted DNA-binding WGR domain protein